MDDDSTPKAPREAPTNADADGPIAAAHWPTARAGAFATSTDPALARSPLDVGEVLQECGRLFAANVLRDLGFVVVFGGAVLLFALLPIGAAVAYAARHGFDPAGTNADDDAVFGVLLLASVAYAIAVSTLGFAFTSGGIIHGALESIEGRRATFGGMARHAASRAFPLLAVSLVQGILVAIGFVLCIFPGVVAGLAFTSAVPFVVHGRRGVVDAIASSFALTSGHRFEIFVVYVATFALVFVANLVTSCLSWVIMLPLGALSAGMGEPGVAFLGAGIVVVWLLVYLLALAFQQLAFAYAPAVVYARLAGLGKTVDAPEIARVFS